MEETDFFWAQYGTIGLVQSRSCLFHISCELLIREGRNIPRTGVGTAWVMLWCALHLIFHVSCLPHCNSRVFFISHSAGMKFLVTVVLLIIYWSLGYQFICFQLHNCLVHKIYLPIYPPTSLILITVALAFHTCIQIQKSQLGQKLISLSLCWLVSIERRKTKIKAKNTDGITESLRDHRI